MTEDEMVGWHHQLDGHEFAQAPGNSEGQESLVGCSPWDHKESDRTDQLHSLKDLKSNEGDKEIGKCLKHITF